MSLSSPLAAVVMLLAGILPAQSLRLAECVAAPLLHLEIRAAAAPAAAGEVATGEAATGEAATGEALPGAGSPDLGSLDGLLQFVEDPAVRRLMGPLAAPAVAPGADAAEAREGEPTPVRHQDLLRALLRLSTGEIELALVGLLPRPTQPSLPLMVGRMHLSDRGVAAVRELLANPDLVTADRGLGAVRCYRFRGTEAARPGEGVELALVGADLLVANHGETLAQVIASAAGDGRTTSAPTGTLAADATHRALVERIRATRSEGAGGSTAVLSLDWAALAPRFTPARGTFERAAWDAFGLDRASRMLFALRRDDDGIATTLVCDAPRGLLGAGAPSDARALAARVPHGGVVGLALALDPRELLGHDGGRGPLDPLVGVCDALGIDFRKHVLTRVDGAVTGRLVWSAPNRDEALFALGVGARSRSSAQALHGLLLEAFERSWRPYRGSGLRPTRGPAPDRLAVVADELVLSLSTESVDEILTRQRDDSRAERAQRESRVRRSLTGLLDRDDQRRAVGVFIVDGQAFGDTGAADHVGVVLDDADGPRIEMLSID